MTDHTADEDVVDLIADEEGITVLGSASAVDRFVGLTGVASRRVARKSVTRLASVGGVALQHAATLGQESGRWIKLTKESSELLKTSAMMKGSVAGTSRTIAMGKKADGGSGITGILEFVNSGVKTNVLNPAFLASVGAVAAQAAMQQQMEEIAEYLQTIDAKVDDIIRAQKDAQIAPVVGADFALQEAFTIRDHVGTVSDTTWSTIQNVPQILHTAHAYALLRLGAVADKLEQAPSLKDLAETVQWAEDEVREWLAVIAHCFRLKDAFAILELDHILDSGGKDLERHRVGLHVSRLRQRESSAKAVGHLLRRISASSEFANSKVLRSPVQARRVVNSGNDVSAQIVAFNHVLGLRHDDADIEAATWRGALAAVGSRVAGSATDGAQLVARGGKAVGTAVVAGVQQVASSVTIKNSLGTIDDVEEEVPWVLVEDEGD